MSDENMREKDRRSPLDMIETVGGAALAITAGAVLLYREGASKYLDEGLSRASRLLGSVKNDLLETAPKDIDAEKLLNIYNKTFNKNTAESLINSYDHKLNIDTSGSSKNIFSILKEIRNRENNPFTLQKSEMLANVKNELKNDLGSRFGGSDNKEFQHKINDFVDYAASHQNQLAYYDDISENPSLIFNQDILDRHFKDSNLTQDQQQSMIETIYNRLTIHKQEVDELMVEQDKLTQQAVDIMLDPENMKKTLGSKTDKNTMNSIKGDRPVTMEEYIDYLKDNKEKFKDTDTYNRSIDKEATTDDMLAMMEDLLEKNKEAYKDIFVDKNLRINKDNDIYSLKQLDDLKKGALDNLANTLPGKLAKMRDFIGAKNAPWFHYSQKGSVNPILAALEEKVEGKETTVLQNSYLRIYDKMYKVEGNELTHFDKADDLYLISGEHGMFPRMLKYMSGETDRRPVNSKILKALDIFTSATPTKWEEDLSIITKFKDKDWAGNIIKYFMNGNFNRENPEEFIHNVSKLNEFFSNNTKPLDRSTISKLSSNSAGATRRLFDILKANDEELISETMKNLNISDGRISLSGTDIKNSDLAALLFRYSRDPKGTSDIVKIYSSKGMIINEVHPIKFKDMLRKEITKEAFLTHASESKHNALAIEQLLKNSGISGREFQESRYMASWAVFQNLTGSYLSKNKIDDIKSISVIMQTMQDTHKLFSGSDEKFSNFFRESIKKIKDEKAPLTQKGKAVNFLDDIITGNNYGKYTYMRKSVSVKDLIKNLNDSTKVKAFGKQFIAGRNSMNNVTTATMFPYFSLMRLIEPLSEYGLGFSSSSTKDVLDLAKNIGLKRVAPTILGYSAFQYMNYRSKVYTGTSISGAFANNRARMDLSRRRLFDNIGLTDKIKENRQMNPFMQYWFGDSRSYDEQLDYYENGYDPVRKGRWWSFGSASEFRGGKIDYFEPNWYKQAQTNWRDIGIWGSEGNKWAHSWLPTPSHPLAPLNKLMNPYYLEKLHYWDRPYPVSGKMFGEGYPLSGVLNATVGAVLKPQIRMHQKELGNSFIDVRDLIAKENDRIKQKAANKNLIKLTQSGDIAALSFTPTADADDTKRVYSIKVDSRGNVKEAGYPGESYGDDVMDFSNYDKVSAMFNKRIDTASSGMGGSLSFGGRRSGDLSELSKISLSEKIDLDEAAGGIAGSMIKKIIPNRAKSFIAKNNQAIFARAAAQRENGVLTPDSVVGTAARFGHDLILNEEAMADIKNTTNTSEFLRDTAYSMKELGGIYGFIGGSILPSRNSHKLQTADKINSFSRKFWDRSLGGWGDEFMEISRRFFPHEDHSIDRINPIRNTMPTWLPSNLQHGDPYAQIPQGEMRLPGRGYESLNKLHKDQYGSYGAFDRMKILADVAPWSQEYKIWRTIASKTIQDPRLKTEMKNIRKRVMKQSRQHEFYPYRFANVDMTTQKGTIDTIVSDTAFTMIGSDKKFRLAGIIMTKDKNGDILKTFIQPGENIRIKYGSDPYSKNQDGSISAIVYVNGENINRKLLKAGVATEKTSDTSPAAAHMKLTESQIDKGRIYEKIAHYPFPYFHNKFARINTPMEAYKEEQIYGSNYSTWNHPIKGFLQPSFNKAFAMGPISQAIGLSSLLIADKAIKSDAPKTLKALSIAATAATNPGAFAGGMLGFMVKLNGNYIEKGAKIGGAVALGGYAITRLQNPIQSTINFAVLGAALTKQLNFKKIGKDIGIREGALAGAAVGLALSSIKNGGFNKDKMFGPWIPKRTKKRWEIEEYYDRLKYIKYMGLYEKAARKALLFEHVNVKRIINQYDADVKRREKLKTKLLAYQAKVSNTYQDGDKRKDAIKQMVNNRLNILKYPTQIFQAGKYTKAALAYKHAAESTIYGLKQDATWINIMRAVPKTDRDFILEFAKERDPNKQKEIMKYMSPYKRKVLELAWGKKITKQKSNASYFASHNLPNEYWAGWKPNVDLDNVEIKTIKNEGMLLSDFGFYDSQTQTENYKNTPPIDMRQQQSAVSLRRKITAVLNGAGLMGVDVSLTPSNKPGIQTIANITRTTDYKVKEKISNLF